ncbi:hypothetical protein FY004_18480 [Streptomyces parvus]|uniref:Uncharacterized protein n=1 Tax=Streptomyces parvus TaxID=66428 RepID=A0A5D4JE32_9ACTN|nr:hypothetical protein FY004_18480 [Streptomyces parvus]
MVRAIARRRSALVAEPRGRFGNAASVRARRRAAGGNVPPTPNPMGSPGDGCPGPIGLRLCLVHSPGIFRGCRSPSRCSPHR